jgi:hypothetical protein
MLERDDPMEEDIVEPLTKNMRIDSNFEYEEESNKRQHLGKSLLEISVVSITQIASSSDPTHKTTSRVILGGEVSKEVSVRRKG